MKKEKKRFSDFATTLQSSAESLRGQRGDEFVESKAVAEG
jgi:hypothetical protein